MYTFNKVPSYRNILSPQDQLILLQKMQIQEKKNNYLRKIIIDNFENKLNALMSNNVSSIPVSNRYVSDEEEVKSLVSKIKSDVIKQLEDDVVVHIKNSLTEHVRSVVSETMSQFSCNLESLRFFGDDDTDFDAKSIRSYRVAPTHTSVDTPISVDTLTTVDTLTPVDTPITVDTPIHVDTHTPVDTPSVMKIQKHQPDIYNYLTEVRMRKKQALIEKQKRQQQIAIRSV